MRSYRVLLLLTVGLTSVLTWLCISQLQAGQEDATQSNSELVKAADMALTSTLADYSANLAKVEDVYRWSRRLMEAELPSDKAAAVADHMDRMRSLHEKAAALYKAGAVGGEPTAYFSTQFYLLEAEALTGK